METGSSKLEALIFEFYKLYKSENTQRLDDVFRFLGENLKLEEHVDTLNIALEISRICIQEVSLDTSVLFSCLLYGFNENLKQKGSEYQKVFGRQHVQIVEGLNKIPEIKPDKLNIQAENFIKLIITIVPNLNSILIKLAIMLHKIRNIRSESAEVQQLHATVVKSLYAPIAHRLGLYSIKTEMEDTCMKYLFPAIYQDIANKLEATRQKRNRFIDEFIAPLKRELSKQRLKCEIKGRPKSIHSIWNKMQTQKVEFDEVYDQFAIRIIIDSELNNEKSDCWKAYSIVTDWYKPNPLRLRDWISSPKSSGYESLHTTVIGPEQKWVEVQIRTVRMDEIAEKGQAAHWKYKEKKENSESDWLSKVRVALESDEAEKDESQDRNKAMLYTDEIFIFTPEGDLRKMHTGYTVLDFAYSIHSDIGETCTGAMVNDKFVPIKQVLKNGDHVKILTSKSQRPRLEWLEFVRSQRSKNKIKRFLKSLDYKDSDQGKDLLKYKLEQLKLAYNDENVKKLMDYFGFKSQIDLYQQIGSGKIEPQKIKKAFADIAINELKAKELQAQTETGISEFARKINKSEFLIIENNLQTIDYQFAKCCNPIPGDDIFGFITVSKGTRIHKKDCSNAIDLISRYPYRIIEAKWNKDAEDSTFIAQIRITGHDNIGVTGSITNIISNEFKLNLRAFNMHPRKDNNFEGIIVTTVNDKKQLDELLARLRRVHDIQSAERFGN
jgi:GTP diphosphokinase / guanosine-3',5'-bis(diphosphate) 3'-diphosphatase